MAQWNVLQLTDFGVFFRHSPLAPHVFLMNAGAAKKNLRIKIYMKFKLGAPPHSVLRRTATPSAPNAHTWIPTSCQAGLHKPILKLDGSLELQPPSQENVGSNCFTQGLTSILKQCSIKVMRRFGVHATMPLAKVLCTLMIEPYARQRIQRHTSYPTHP